MNTYTWVYTLGVVLLAFGLPIFSYLTLIYRELGRMNTGRVHEHLEIFEAEIEPKLRIKRRSGGPNIPHFGPLLAGVSGSRDNARRGLFRVGELGVAA